MKPKKPHRKSTLLAYWVLRILAVSCALVLFSVTGIVAMQTATHATASDTATVGTTLSPADVSPTDTVVPPTVAPTSIPTANPTATVATVPTPTPRPVPTKTPTKPPVTGPTPTPIPPSSGVTPTSTPAGGGALPPPVTKGTPKANPSPTPPGSPTPDTSGTPVPTASGGATSPTSAPSKTQSDSGGLTAMIKPLVWPITGVGTTILLSSVGLLGLMLWRKRTVVQDATSQLQLSTAQASIPWMDQQAAASNVYYPQSAQAPAAQDQNMIPFAMQSIAQYSPFLGAPDSSHLDAPAPPPASDFRPLTLDFPHILAMNTDKVPVPMSPSAQVSSPNTEDVVFQPAPLFSTPLSPMPGSLNAISPATPAPAQTPIPSAQHPAPVAYQFPPHDPSLENLMHQAQMGIFALPGKDA
jgi:hypothetical protein